MMSAASLLLEIPEVRARISPVTVEQYHTFPEKNENGKRTELIRGFVIEKKRKSPLHSFLTTSLYQLWYNALPPDLTLHQYGPLTFADSEPEPELAVVRGSESDFREHHPSTALLAIEVVDGPAQEERLLANLYAEANVAEYWIVLAREQLVEVYRSPHDGAYRECFVAAASETLTCSSAPAISMRLDELFA